MGQRDVEELTRTGRRVAAFAFRRREAASVSTATAFLSFTKCLTRDAREKDFRRGDPRSGSGRAEASFRLSPPIVTSADRRVCQS